MDETKNTAVEKAHIAVEMTAAAQVAVEESRAAQVNLIAEAVADALKKKATEGDEAAFVTITNGTIYKKQLDHEELIRATLEQTKKTNGRVTVLEKRSIGIWISNHPLGFAFIIISMMSLMTPDVRDSIIKVIAKFI